MNYNELAQAIHQNAVEHGWWDKKRSDAECIALMHSELSEALEELRNGHAVDEIYYNGDKPEGFAVELADCEIRILDWCAYHNLDIEEMAKEYDFDIFDKQVDAWKKDFKETPVAHITNLHIMLSDIASSNAPIEKYILIIWYIHLILAAYNLNLEKIMLEKMAYNKTRPYKHGKAF